LGAGNGGLGRSQSVNGAIASANANIIAAARVDVYGGNGGSSEAGNASHGGNADVTDAVSATTSASGTINLSQSVGAGHGGNTQSGQVGNGGNAINELSVTANVQRLEGYFTTYAGSGGSRTNTLGTAGNAGNSTSSMEMTNSGDVDLSIYTGNSDYGYWTRLC
jgi:hypothetical protein